MFKTRRQSMPMPTGSPKERAEFISRLAAELPAVVHHLVNMEIPSDIADPRFGLKAYHHPHLLAALDSLSPEIRLLNLIDMYLFSRPTDINTERGRTAEEIEQMLTDRDSAVLYEVRNLFSWNNACGTYLGRLARKCPGRVRFERSTDRREWFIAPPNMPFPEVEKPSMTA